MQTIHQDTAAVIPGVLHATELASRGAGKDAPLPETPLAGQQLSGLHGFTPRGNEPDSSLS